MDQKNQIQVPDKSHKVAIKVSHRKITKPYYLVLRVVLHTNTLFSIDLASVALPLAWQTCLARPQLKEPITHILVEQ